MSRNRLLIVLGAAGILAAAPGVPAGAATPAPRIGICNPGLGIGLADAGSNVRDPRARLYVVSHVAPGAHFTRRIRVCNGTTQPLTVKLYAGAANVTAGAFTIVEGRVGNALSSWITLTPALVTIPSGQERIATATFDVPRDAEGGEHYGVLLAELPPRPSASGISVASRVGVRVYLDVGAGKAPKSDFVVDSLQAARRADGAALVTAQVHNTGARALDMSGSLTLRDGPGGLGGGPFPAELGTTLAPGQTEPVTIVLDKSIRGGPWTARLTLHSGLLTRKAEAALTFPESAGATAQPVPAKNLPLAKDRKVLIPVAAGLIFLLFLLLLVIGLLTSRRKAKEEQEAPQYTSA